MLSEDSGNGSGRRNRLVYGNYLVSAQQKASCEYANPAGVLQALAMVRRGAPGLCSGLATKFDLRVELLVQDLALALDLGQFGFALVPSKA